MGKSQTTRLRQALLPVPVGLLFLLGSMMYPSPSWAWGDLGHKIICQIAFEELNERVRNEVIRLIALDATFNSFTDACTWPDHPRKRAEEHFINVGLGHEGSSKRARNLLRIVAWDASECGGLRRCVSEIIKKSGNVWDESLTLHHEIFPRYIAFLTLSRSIVVG